MTENSQAKKVYKLLAKKKKTLSVAESCTGGLVSSLITDISGSSDYFIGSVVAYSNDIKIRVLGVPRDLIKKKGAVSAEVAVKMAEGARKLFKTDVAAAVTGIAGPSGGSTLKPVGLAYIAVTSNRKTVVKKVLFKGTRPVLKKKFAEAVLRLLSTECGLRTLRPCSGSVLSGIEGRTAETTSVSSIEYRASSIRRQPHSPRSL